MIRVRWTPEEQEHLISKAAQLLHQRQAFSLKEAFDKAQDTLPPQRRRQIAALTQIRWFTENAPKRVKAIEEQERNGTEVKIAQAVAEATARAYFNLQEEWIRKAGNVLAKIMLVALEDPELRSLLVNNGPPPKRVTVRHVTKDKRKRVVVVGTLNAQAHTLEKEFANELDIRFWNKDQSKETLKAMLQNAEAAVAMVGFLSHAHDAIVKASQAKYIPVSGGMTQVKATLQKLLESET